MKKSWVPSFTALVVLWTILSPLGAAAETPGPLLAQRPAAPGKPLPGEIAIAALRPGTTFYSVAAGIAKVLSERTPMRASVLPLAGTADVLTAVNRGEVEFGICSSQTCWQTFKGVEGFPKIPTIRIAQVGIPLRVGWVARKDSGLRTFTDVRGKLVTRHRVSSFAVYDRAFLANAGLTWNDVKPVDVTDVTAGIGVFKEGRAEVAEHSLGSAHVAEANAMVPGGVRWLSADPSPEAVERARRATFPGFYSQLVKSGSFVGIVEDTQFLVVDIYLATHKNVREDVVRTVVETLWTHYRDLAPVHPALKEWAPERFVSATLAIPMHPAAVALYKEKGLWKPDVDPVQQRLLKEAGE